MKIPSKNFSQNDHKSISTLDSVQNLIETISRMLSHLSESGSDCKSAFHEFEVDILYQFVLTLQNVEYSVL